MLEREEVLKLAKLSRLEVAEGDIEAVKGHLDKMLDHLEALKALDLSNVEPMTAVENGSLSSVPVEWSADSCCCVMIASGGYPEAYEKGKAIDLGKASEYAQVYHSGTALDDEGHLVTSGGRVLGLSATAPTLKEAVDQAYRAAGEVRFDGAFFRHDIGQRALNA